MNADHPAPFSDYLLPVLADVLSSSFDDTRHIKVLDPFAGIGRVHLLNAYTHGAPNVESIGVELEAEWATQTPGTITGDSRDLSMFGDGTFDAVVTSPCYGNRMADHHEAKDPCSCRKDHRGHVSEDADPDCPKCHGRGLSHRRTYTHYLGRKLTDGNAGAMQWGDAYRELHEAVWRECWRVLALGGLFVLNIKDHQRKGRWQHVPEWHRETLQAIGFKYVDTIPVAAKGYKFGDHRNARADDELVIVFDVPEAP